jgi:hypothetical protein
VKNDLGLGFRIRPWILPARPWVEEAESRGLQDRNLARGRVTAGREGPPGAWTRTATLCPAARCAQANRKLRWPGTRMWRHWCQPNRCRCGRLPACRSLPVPVVKSHSRRFQFTNVCAVLHWILLLHAAVPGACSIVVACSVRCCMPPVLPVRACAVQQP